MDDKAELQHAVERMHTCRATLAQSVPVSEAFEGKTVWEGTVHVFDLTGHPKATRAYAWSSPIDGSDKRRFFAVLRQGPVTSPVEAVRAAIVQEHRARGRKLKRERFTTPVTCPECALNGSAIWEESERRDLETTIKSISDGFRIERSGTEIYCAECGVKAKIGKSLSRSEMKMK
jgi:ribosomal protein S26